MRKTAIMQAIEWVSESHGFNAIELIDKLNELLETEKQQIIEAVNEHDKRCIDIANNVIQKINPDCKLLFEHDIETGLNYYNSEFQK